MDLVDIGIIVVLVISVLIGIMRGFVREVLSLIAWVVSFWVAYNFSTQAAPMFAQWISDAMLQWWIAFIVLFMVSLIVLSLFSFILRRLLSIAGIGGVDRSLGAIFGGIRGAVIVAAVVACIRAGGFDEQRMVGTSRLVTFFEPAIQVFVDILPARLKTGIPNVAKPLARQALTPQAGATQ